MALVWLRRRGCCQPPYVVHPDRVCTGCGMMCQAVCVCARAHSHTAHALPGRAPRGPGTHVGFAGECAARFVFAARLCRAHSRGTPRWHIVVQ